MKQFRFQAKGAPFLLGQRYKRKKADPDEKNYHIDVIGCIGRDGKTFVARGVEDGQTVTLWEGSRARWVDRDKRHYTY